MSWMQECYEKSPKAQEMADAATEGQSRHQEADRTAC